MITPLARPTMLSLSRPVPKTSVALLDGEEIGWQSPVRGPVHPEFVPLMEPGGLGWLDGFDELLVRCGLESNGAPDFDDSGKLIYQLHGRIANRPAHRVDVSVDDSTGEITVTGVVEETRFHFSKLRLTSKLVTRVNDPTVHLCDQVENLSGSEAEVQMLYHINFGQPLLQLGLGKVVISIIHRLELTAVDRH